MGTVVRNDTTRRTSRPAGRGRAAFPLAVPTKDGKQRTERVTTGADGSPPLFVDSSTYAVKYRDGEKASSAPCRLAHGGNLGRGPRRKSFRRQTKKAAVTC